MRKIILMLCFLLLVGLPVQAKTVTFTGIGELDLPEDITVAEIVESNNNIDYFLKVRDGAVWRSAVVYPFKEFMYKDMDKIKPDSFLKLVTDHIGNNDPNVFGIEKAKLITLAGREVATETFKLQVPSAGFIGNMELILITGSFETKLFIFACADADTQYWRPILQNIFVSIR